MIGYRSRINKTVIIGRVKRTYNLSLIKKEAAEVLGSCVASPRMTVEKGYCHLEPRAIARGCKDLINKCRDCIELTRLKQVRIKLKRDLYGDFACAQPLKMTMIICFALCLGVAGEARAEKCVSDGKTTSGGKYEISGESCKSCGKNCDWELTSVVDKNNNPVFLEDGETPAQKLTVSTTNGATGVEMPFNPFGHPLPWNSALQTITDVEIGYGITSIRNSAFWNASNLINISLPEGLTNIQSASIRGTSLTNIVLPETVTSIGAGAFQMNSKLESIIIPDGAILASEVFWATSAPIICLGDIERCKQNFANAMPCIKKVDGVCVEKNYSKLVPATEEQCKGKYEWANGACGRIKNEAKCNSILNSAGKQKYYFDGELCQDRPFDLSNITCIGGYAKLKGNCVDPLKTFAKKRYTPAEAAQWLNEDDNTVTLTFKK